MMAAPESTNVDVTMAARQYLALGWVLVPIPPGTKGPHGPDHVGWNLRQNCISTIAHLTKIPAGYGIGLAHTYSRTCVIDLDDLAQCRDWLFDEHLINIDQWLDAADAVQISSGRDNRAKLLYRLPDGVAVLPSIKLEEINLELRCGTSTNRTVQDVLPPSVHPITGQPYTWGGAGNWQSLPTLPCEMLEVWQMLAQRDAEESNKDPEGLTVESINSMLSHLDPDLDYPIWINVLMGVHHETRGGKSGLDLVNEWSSRGTKFKGKADIAKFWRSLKGSGITIATVRKMARDSGWAEDVTSLFEVVTNDIPAPDLAREALRRMERDRNGRPLATANNLARALIPEICAMRIAKDTFRDAVMWAPPGTNEWRPFRDSDYVEIRLTLERLHRFKPISRELLRDLVDHASDKAQFDSAQLWLNSLQWDGVPRVETFLRDFFGVGDTPYTRAVSTYTWTALAGRVLAPGVKADMVPILVGEQGAGKSTAVMEMVPAPEHYVEIDFGADEDDLARKMRGTLIAEFAELKGLRSRELEHIKAFITRQHENWTPKFREFNQTYPRRTLFIGTTNQIEFLADETGNRRWLPVNVGQVDVPGIAAARIQLWAEAAFLFSVEGGVAWRDAERLARLEHERHMVSDPWEDAIEKWIDAPEQFGDVARKFEGFRIADLLYGALAINSKEQNRGVEMRAGAILRKFGLVKKDIKVNGCVSKRWKLLPVATSSDEVATAEIPF